MAHDASTDPGAAPDPLDPLDPLVWAGGPDGESATAPGYSPDDDAASLDAYWSAQITPVRRRSLLDGPYSSGDQLTMDRTAGVPPIAGADPASEGGRVRPGPSEDRAPGESVGHRRDPSLRFDPLSDGEVSQSGGQAGELSVALGLGEVAVIDGVRFQAVPFVSRGVTGGGPEPLVATDDGNTPVEVGRIVTENLATGRRAFGERLGSHPVNGARWDANARVAYAESLRAEGNRDLEAFGHLVAAADLSGPGALEAHMRLAAWHIEGMPVIPAHNAEAAPALPSRSQEITRHALAAAADGGPHRDQVSVLVLKAVIANDWPPELTGALDRLAAQAHQRGDRSWAEGMLIAAATQLAARCVTLSNGVGPSGAPEAVAHRRRATAWIEAGLETTDAAMRDRAVSAFAQLVTSAIVSRDADAVVALRIVVGRAPGLSAEQRAALSMQLGPGQT